MRFLRPRRGFTLLELLVVLMILGILAGIAIPTFNTLLKKSRAQCLAAHTCTATGPIPQSTPPVTSAPVHTTPTDLTPLWIVLGIISGLVLLVGLSFMTYHLFSRAAINRRTQRSLQLARAERWAALRTQADSLTAEYNSYLEDMVAVLRRPALSDVTVPQTEAFVEAYHSLSLFPTSSTPHESETIDRYDSLVSAAWGAWRRADAYATKAGLNLLPEHDRHSIEKAIRLLALAQDPGATDFERAHAFEEARKLVDGLVVLPKQALLALEKATRKAIVAA